MALSYRRWVYQNVLREEPGPILSESILQRIWFESLFQNPLTTLQGELVTLHHPGFWNHRPGPDFLRASFSTPDGRTHAGDVEIHRHSSDWEAHGHGSDPAYRQVILHVFWQADPSLIETPPTSIRQIALAHQLAAPLTELISLFRATPAEIAGGEKAGLCHTSLLSLQPEKLREILEEAGSHRLRQRRALATARTSSHGLDQAVWIALSEGLGFSENREPFTSLARAVPVQLLSRMPDPACRASLLYGVAGLLPDPTTRSVSPRAQPILKELWNHWWKARHSWTDRILPPTLWKMGSTRPNNSPFRRIAALATLSDPHTWPELVDSVHRAQSARFLEILKSASHPFWDHHAGWDGRLLPSRSRLIGLDRAHALLFQVLAPFADCDELTLHNTIATWPTGGDAGLIRSACLRLFGLPFAPAELRSHLAREGLLQIYKDFCRSKADACQNCSMPDFLKQRNRPPEAKSPTSATLSPQSDHNLPNPVNRSATTHPALPKTPPETSPFLKVAPVGPPPLAHRRNPHPPGR